MKWDKPNGSVQYSADRRYIVMQANTKDWIAYRVSGFGTSAEKLGERHDDEAARACCELDKHNRDARKSA